jgi:hypothetical protein
VFWYNLHRNGEGDDLTRHAACPVLAGTKWGKITKMTRLMTELLHPLFQYPTSGFTSEAKNSLVLVLSAPLSEIHAKSESKSASLIMF